MLESLFFCMGMDSETGACTDWRKPCPHAIERGITCNFLHPYYYVACKQSGTAIPLYRVPLKAFANLARNGLDSLVSFFYLVPIPTQQSLSTFVPNRAESNIT